MVTDCFLGGADAIYADLVVELVYSSVQLAIAMLSLFFVIALSWNFFNNMIQSGRLFKMGSFLGIIVSALCVILYIPIINILSQFICAIIGAYPDSPDLGTSWEASWTDWLNGAWDWMTGSNATFWQQIVSSGAVYVIKLVLGYLRTFILGFLLIVGPLALCLDLVPLLRGLARKWVTGLIVVGMWGLTMKILDYLFFGYMESYLAGTDYFVLSSATLTGDVDAYLYMVINLTMILMYIMTPFLTSMFVGNTMANSMGGKVWGMAMLGGALAVRAGTGLPMPSGRGGSRDQQESIPTAQKNKGEPIAPKSTSREKGRAAEPV